MLMQFRRGGGVVEVMSPEDLWDPMVVELMVDVQIENETSKEPELISKRELCFLSGERLPTCWLDPHYRDVEWIPYHFGKRSRVTDKLRTLKL